MRRSFSRSGATILLFRLLPPPQRLKHKEDRLRALAGLFQTFALSAWGLGIVTPLVTGDAHFSSARAITCLFIGVSAEAISLTLLSYIPYPADQEETKTDG